MLNYDYFSCLGIIQTNRCEILSIVISGSPINDIDHYLPSMSYTKQASEPIGVHCAPRARCLGKFRYYIRMEEIVTDPLPVIFEELIVRVSPSSLYP